MKKIILLLSIVLLTGALPLFLISCGGDDPVAEIVKPPVTPPTNNGDNNNSDNPTTTPGELAITQSCQDCSGNGNCPTCHGSGKYCKTCNSTGKCLTCDGTGECFSCHGSGDCFRCEGTGKMDCSYCTYGYCNGCSGKGWVTRVEWKCTVCGGSGQCRICGGNYRNAENCYTCDGKKRCQVCKDPNGRCGECKGNKYCKTCGGDAHCATCVNNPGKCNNCSGNGEVQVTKLDFVYKGASSSIRIQSNTEWKVTSNADWLSLSSTSGSGNGTLSIRAAANPTTVARNATITFTYGSSTTTVSVYQQGEPEYLTLSSTDPISFGLKGGSKTLTINSNVNWTVSCNSTWLKLSTASGSGNGSLTLSTEENNTTGTRNATVYINYSNTSAKISVSQEGINFSWSPSTLSTFASIGETKYLSITSNVDWKASCAEDWLTISPSSGSGDRTMSITAKVNAKNYSRSATITFTSAAGTSTLTVRQEAGPSTPFVIKKVEFGNTDANGNIIHDYGTKSYFERYEPKFIHARIECASYVSGSYDIYFNIVTPDGFIPKNVNGYSGRVGGYMSAGSTYKYITTGFQFTSGGYSNYWEPGKYRMDFYYNGSLMASNTFQVYY